MQKRDVVETERKRLSPETGWLEGRGPILHKEGRE